MNAIRTALCVVLSLPLLVLWLGMYLLLFLGWGLAIADQFMLHWNKFAEQSDLDIVRKTNEANG